MAVGWIEVADWSVKAVERLMALIRRRRTRLLLSPENGPGKALVRVENLGERQEFTASARMLDVRESRIEQNKFLQTFALRWETTGEPTLVLNSGGSSSVLLATSVEEPGGRDLFEVKLEGFRDRAPTQVDWRRWRGNDPDGAVTFVVEVRVSGEHTRKPATGSFLIQTRRWGGLSIECMTDTTTTGGV